MPEALHRACHLCEAGCGLSFQVEHGKILAVRPDREDPRSQGYACPKGIHIADIQEDPDRIRRPLRRTVSGDFEEVSWEVALGETTERLAAIRKRDGADALGIYMGTPVVHDHGASLVRSGLLEALGTRNSFSAGSQDTSPRFATSWHLYGSSFVVPIPDVQRTDYFLCIGANPIVSNGSAMTAPDMRRRLRALKERGGRLVVVDPRRTETAREADEHVAVLPGGDAALLFGMLRVLLDEGLEDRAAIDATASGFAEVEARVRRLDPKALARSSGVPWDVIARLAREFAAAPSSVAYSRIGVCNSRYGSLATYAGDLLNLAAGRLGAVGGAMFPVPAADLSRMSRLPGMDGHGRRRSRVRGLPETLGDLPSACLAEEIETEGPGQIRGLITYAGNPVLSVPNGKRLDRAFASLEFMVSIDLYLNETTRHADILLPTAWSLTEEHYDVFFANFAVEDYARLSPPVVEKQAEDRNDWEILLALAEGLGGGLSGVGPLDALVRAARKRGYGLTPDHVLDALLRTGAHGDGFLPKPLRFGRYRDGLSLAALREMPRGAHLGPMQPGVAHRVLHREGRVRVDPAPFLDAFDDWARDPTAATPADGDLLLVGRREIRSNNSWMHNVPAMVSGRDRCVLTVHPEDAARLGLEDGGTAVLESRIHTGEVPVAVSDEMRPGVVSLPHGWGHQRAAATLRVAGELPGVSFNDWSDDAVTEAVVGQSVLNGVPVTVRAA